MDPFWGSKYFSLEGSQGATHWTVWSNLVGWSEQYGEEGLGSQSQAFQMDCNYSLGSLWVVVNCNSEFWLLVWYWHLMIHRLMFCHPLILSKISELSWCTPLPLHSQVYHTSLHPNQRPFVFAVIMLLTQFVQTAIEESSHQRKFTSIPNVIYRNMNALKSLINNMSIWDTRQWSQYFGFQHIFTLFSRRVSFSS